LQHELHLSFYDTADVALCSDEKNTMLLGVSP